MTKCHDIANQVFRAYLDSHRSCEAAGAKFNELTKGAKAWEMRAVRAHFQDLVRDYRTNPNAAQ